MVKRVKLDTDVEKAITAAGLNLNEVLRNAMGLRAKPFTTPEGLEIPDGTDFMVWYAGRSGEGRPYWAKLRNGKLEMRGREFDSVTAAAAAVTGRPTTNGWEFWQVKFPGQVKFTPLRELRSPHADKSIHAVTE